MTHQHHDQPNTVLQDRKAKSRAIGGYLAESFTRTGAVDAEHSRLMQHALRCPQCRDVAKAALGITERIYSR